MYFHVLTIKHQQTAELTGKAVLYPFIIFYYFLKKVLVYFDNHVSHDTVLANSSVSKGFSVSGVIFGFIVSEIS